MIYGLYFSAQGAEAQSARLDVIANNLANADTTGFKRDLALFRSHPTHAAFHGEVTEPPGDLNNHSGGVTLDGVATDFTNGSLLPTGNSLDVALEGPGFFQVGDGNEKFLTRNGQFAVNDENVLVMSSSGTPVLDDSGAPISIPEIPGDLQIADDGTVSFVAAGQPRIAQPIANLGIVEPESVDALQKLGDSLYRPLGDVRAIVPGTVEVHQGHLEASGVNSVDEMMQMIEASRAFESNINMAKYQDESLARLIGTMRPR